MSTICEEAVIISLASAFIILFIGKIGLRDYVISHSPVKLISQLFSCDFCLSFWVSLFISIGYCYFNTEVYFSLLHIAAIPVLAAPITRMLI